MDSTALSLYRASFCTQEGQRQAFDALFQRYIVGDELGQVRAALDTVVSNGNMPASAVAFVYSFLFPSTQFNDDDDSELMLAFCAALLVQDFRGDVIKRQRLNWDRHVKSLRRQGLFRRFYRMSYEAFCILLELLRPALSINATKSMNRTSNQDPIGPELILHCTLRFLAGASYLDVMVHTGISKPAFYTCVYKGLDAICGCQDLDLKMPRTLTEFHDAAFAFQQMSLDGRLNGCIGALDGWLCRIKVPSQSETMNVSSYFSVHYQCYGVNVQATCDANCRFTSISILCPGGSGDSKAFAASSLQQFVSTLPRGFYVVADNAYTLSDTLLIPYSGVDKADPSKDVFNFYLSQLRIRIEQALGFLVNSWRIFKRPLEVKLFRVGHIVQACARLHNFCINNRDEKIPIISQQDPDHYSSNFEEFLPPAQTLTTARARRCAVREAIRAQLAADGCRRPQFNLDRNSARYQ